MKQEYVNPFLIPAKTIWEKELGCVLDFEEFDTLDDQFTSEDVTVHIRVKGLIQGHVLYGFDMETALTVAGTMMGEEIDELDGIAMSAIGELANMISGHAATELASAGFFCQISPPSLILPAKSKFTSDQVTQIMVVFDSDLGPLNVRIGLNEASDEDSLDWLWQRMNADARKRR